MTPSSRFALAAAILFVILALPGVAAAKGHHHAPPTAGAYSGTVAPGYAISFEVAAGGSSVNDLVVAFKETCNGTPPATAPLFHFPTLPLVKGRFHGSVTLQLTAKASDHLRIKGRFKDGVFTGKVKSKSKVKGVGNCVQYEPFSAKLN